MHKKVQISRAILIISTLFTILVSFLAGYLCALKAVGDDNQKAIDTTEQRANNSN